MLSCNPFVAEVLALAAGVRLEPLSLRLQAEGRDRRRIVRLRESADIGFDTAVTGWRFGCS